MLDRPASGCGSTRRPAPARLPGRLDALVDGAPRHRPHRVRPVRPAGVRLLASSTCCPRTAATLARFLVGSEGTLGGGHSTPPSGWSRTPRTGRWSCSATPTWPTAADAVPALLHAPAGRLRGPRRAASSTWCAAARARRRARRCRAGGGWLFVEVAGDDRRRGRAPRPRRLAATPARSTLRWSPTPAEAAALWRIREDGAGLAGRSPPTGRRTPGWEDAAVPPERLGAYLRDFDALLRRARPRRACPTATSATAACTSGSTSRSTSRGGAGGFRAFVEDAGRPGRRARRLAVRRARRRPGPLRAAAADVLADGDRPVRARSSASSTRQPAQPRRARRPAPARRRPAAGRRRLREPRPGAAATPHDGGDLADAVHRCTGVGKCRADNTGAGGVMCPSYLATRDEKDSTRGRARVLQEMVNGTLVTGGWRLREVHEALDLCLSCKGCASDCPTGVDMATYKAEVLHQRYRRRLAAAQPLRARLAAALGPAGRSRSRRLANRLMRVGRRCRGWRRRPPASTSAAPLPAFAAEPLRRWARARRAASPGRTPRRRALGRLVHRPLRPGRRPGRGRGAGGGRATRRRDPPSAACCGLTWITTGQLDRGPAASARAPSTCSHPYVAAGRPGRRAGAVLHWRCCARDAVELLPTTRGPPRSRAGVRIAGRAADRTRRLARRPT